jgi:NAD+ synthetase
MKVALCQINPIIGDFEHNTALIREASSRAKAEGCTLAVFPELSLIGYPPKDLLEKPSFIEENLRRLEKLAEETSGLHILCGYVDRNPKRTGKPLLNSVALLGNGRILANGAKRRLPTYDVFDETRYFEPSERSLLFELDGKRFGVTVCEDIWNMGDMEGVPRYEADPVSEFAALKIDILVNMSASPYTVNKKAVRHKILEKVCRKHGLVTLHCNQVGGNDELLFDGASMVFARDGNLTLMGKEFEPDLLVWESEKSYPEAACPLPSEEESILKGLVMGTRDYVTKCGFSKALVGLSGGIDSSLVAVIAQRALGPENVIGVSMPSSFTSAMSREDAKRLAGNLNIKLIEIPISGLYDGYVQSLADAFRGLRQDETEENIQARIRGTLLMALSNKYRALLLSTGNKSEIATGYCTLYGDMNGGLAVLSDIPKTLCYRLASYINRNDEIIPPRVITRPPSAELRPDQTDQDTLPPYDILDQILDAAVVKNLSYDEIVARGYDPGTVKDVLRRIARNEYKRRQSPPGLKVTSKAFGYGRRYPIARGKELY